MDASADPSTDAAAHWARTISRRRYLAHRHEMDALVVATVPAYADAVERALKEFEASFERSTQQYDATHTGAESGRPWRPRLQLALFWAYLLSVAGALAAVAPSGGRSFGAAYFPSSSWKYLVALSFALFALGVALQLVRAIVTRRAGIPPRKDIAWLPTVLGVPAIGFMVWRVSQNIGVDPLWVVLTGIVLAVSVVYCVVRIVQRGRDRRLTRRVDASETVRERALRDALYRHADEYAERIAREFAALPKHDRDRLTRSFEQAANVLRERGFIRTINAKEAKVLARGTVQGRRTAVPGFLLLARRVREIWRPEYTTPRGVLRARWPISEFELEPRSSRKRTGVAALL